MKLRLGTRGSDLALWQARETTRLLAETGIETEICVVRTTGDSRQDVSLASIGGKGLFIKELEEALLRGEVDLAVHSLKDVPSILPDEFQLAAFLRREDPRDVWIHRDGISPENAPKGTRVGTSAPRRRGQLAAAFPQLVHADIRGNVETRIRKMREGTYDAIVLAAAGMRRLGLIEQATAFISVEQMVPAAGQAIVGIECLRSRNDIAELLSQINDASAASDAAIERGLLQRFGFGLDCHSAVAAHARTLDGVTRLDVFWTDDNTKKSIRFAENGAPEAVVNHAEARIRAELGVTAH